MRKYTFKCDKCKSVVTKELEMQEYINFGAFCDCGNGMHRLYQPTYIAFGTGFTKSIPVTTEEHRLDTEKHIER